MRSCCSAYVDNFYIIFILECYTISMNTGKNPSSAGLKAWAEVFLVNGCQQPKHLNEWRMGSGFLESKGSRNCQGWKVNMKAAYETMAGGAASLLKSPCALWESLSNQEKEQEPESSLLLRQSHSAWEHHDHVSESQRQGTQHNSFQGQS